MKSEYVLPAYGLDAFNCPKCHVYCRQTWYYMRGAENANGMGLQYQDSNFMVTNCERCNFPTIWHDDKIIYPLTTTAEAPNPDLPAEIQVDYEEARAIANQSPRGSAALLRLAIQKLCKHLGEAGENINADIAALVKKGLPPKVQEALDSVRVIGNNAVHPGELDLRDDRETANKLFRLVNFTAQKMITEPAEIDAIYKGLPASKLDGIKKRDKK